MILNYKEDNDLIEIMDLTSEGFGENILMLAPEYPAGGAVVTREFLESNRGRKMFIEYPVEVYGLEFDEPAKTVFERTVITSGKLGQPGTILMQHGCWFRRVKNLVEPLLVTGKVAGYRHAVYGVPEDAVPLLFTHPDYPDALIAASGFSNFVRARYAPREDWRCIWNYILNWLGAGEVLPLWDMAVRPAYQAQEELPELAELQAFEKSVKWFSDNALALHTEVLVTEGRDSTRSSALPVTRCRGPRRAATVPAKRRWFSPATGR